MTRQAWAVLITRGLGLWMIVWSLPQSMWGLFGLAKYLAFAGIHESEQDFHPAYLLGYGVVTCLGIYMLVNGKLVVKLLTRDQVSGMGAASVVRLDYGIALIMCAIFVRAFGLVLAISSFASLIVQIPATLSYFSVRTLSDYPGWAFGMALQLVGMMALCALGMYMLLNGRALIRGAMRGMYENCPMCGYDIEQFSGHRCPECGGFLPGYAMSRDESASGTAEKPVQD